jgi:hypothetical protein
MPGGLASGILFRRAPSATLELIRMTDTPYLLAPNPVNPNPVNLRQVRLRANPAYELILFDRLSEAEQQALRGLGDDPDCYGVLRPRDSSSSLKAVSRDTALLLLSLQQAGPLPRYAARSLGEDGLSSIAKMILDGILEIEANGEMISGAAASALVCGDAAAVEKESSLAAMSRRAVEYAAALELSDPLALSARLYAYNCIPASPLWRTLLPKDAATAEYLGLVDGAAARVMSREWRALPDSPAWISWQARSSRWEKTYGSEPATTYKLYVSPACDQLREVVQAIADAVARSNAMQWKVGKGIYGLLRPDKMVIYFHQLADLREVALKIMNCLEGCVPHGVPFTAELAGAGLLSWGVDPPDEAHVLPWLEGESWRGKVCNQLALALVQAGNEAGGDLAGDTPVHMSAARFAIQRLRLEGIDTDTWTPAPGMTWDS